MKWFFTFESKKIDELHEVANNGLPKYGEFYKNGHEVHKSKTHSWFDANGIADSTVLYRMPP